MKFKAIIFASAILGLSGPVAAHAQLIDNLTRRVAEGPQQGQGQNRGGGRGDRNNDDRPQGRPQIERPPMRLVPINQVIAQISRMVPGRLLDADASDPGSSRPVYRIRWQAESGQRIDFTVDAQSGAIIGRSGG